MDGLTPPQENCLLLIRDYLRRKGQAPTRRELADLAGQKSTNGINQILRALEKKGYVKSDPPNRPRNIAILRLPVRQLSLLDQDNVARDSGGAA